MEKIARFIILTIALLATYGVWVSKEDPETTSQQLLALSLTGSIFWVFYLSFLL